MQRVRRLLEFINRYAEPIKIGFAVVGAAYVLLLYYNAEQDAKIRRTIDYANHFQSGSLFEVRAEIDKTWMEPDNLKALQDSVKSSDSTIPIKRATQLLVADATFRKNVIQLIDFYSSISSCALHNQCDLNTVCLMFGERMKNARVLYGEYFSVVSAAFRNDMLATLRAIDDKCVEKGLVDPW